MLANLVAGGGVEGADESSESVLSLRFRALILGLEETPLWPSPDSPLVRLSVSTSESMVVLTKLLIKKQVRSLLESPKVSMGKADFERFFLSNRLYPSSK